MKKYLLFISVFFTFIYSFGFDYTSKQKNNESKKRGTCAPSSASLIMQYNDVSALLEPSGTLFLDRKIANPGYFVPKNSGSSAIYTSSIWIGGIDVNNNLKLAAQKFRSAGNDFWTGPISMNPNTNGDFDPSKPMGDGVVRNYGNSTISDETCTAFDKFFTIRKSEVVQFVTWFECSKQNQKDCISPSNEILNRIYAWPAHGDQTKNQDYYLAPFKDVDNDGKYDPLNGDYPWYDDILGRDDIKCGSDRRISLFGDETHWWVFNDVGGPHTESSGEAIGLEIRAQAFVFATSDELNQMSFYNYEIINRSTQTLNKTYFGQYVDADLGGAPDDFVGCDVTRGLGFCYNGDANDDDYRTQKGYGANPPAIGVDFFEGPYQDADGKDNVGPKYIDKKWVVPSVYQAIEDNGIVYGGLGIGYGDGIIDNERYGMKRFTYYTGGGANNQSDPTFALQYYNYMSGKWRYGDDMVYGGTGFPSSKGATNIHSNHMFPGDSDTLNWSTSGVNPGSKNWDEKSSGNTPGDRRFVQSAGPFTLRPGSVNSVTVGVVYARGYTGDLFSSVEALKMADSKAQLLFDNCFKTLEAPYAPKTSIIELNKEILITLENPNGSNNYLEKFQQEDNSILDLPNSTNTDKTYRFEGYQIYQLADKNVTINELDDPYRAKVVAQCDLKNGVKSLVNFEFNPQIGFSVPIKKVSAEDKGIRHSFKITTDLFAKGDTMELINNKKYYYVAVAYAFNRFKVYDPNDPNALNGQKTPYIRSNKSYDGTLIKAIEVEPHYEAGKDLIPAVNYGFSPKITRIDGKGNGNRWLELTDESRKEIVINGKSDITEYKEGKGPLNIKVIDPLNVSKGYYVCRFTGYEKDTIKTYTNFNGVNVDKASWVIYKYDKEGGTLLDSVLSDKTIDYDDEQIIPRWGVSININQQNYYFTTDTYFQEYLRYTDPINSTSPNVDIYFKDESKKWLSFIKDVDNFNPINWIRSGIYIPILPENNTSLGLYNPFLYPDEKGIDPNKKYDKLLGGGIAPHCLVGYQGDFMPLAYPSFFNKSMFSQARQYTSISRLSSIDIVFTSDTTLWTRCPVIELGRNKLLNEGEAEAGTLRRGKSVDKLGNKLTDSFGMGWFPGYAIDIESGMRLHMAFGENSSLVIDNGRDMIWNPTSTIYDSEYKPHMGGQHAIYIFGNNVHGYRNDLNKNCPYYDGKNNWVYDKLKQLNSPNNFQFYFDAYHSLQWIVNPILTANSNLLATDVTLKVRINKEYQDFVTSNINKGRPMYSWKFDEKDMAKVSVYHDKSDLTKKYISVYPNPFSEEINIMIDKSDNITRSYKILTLDGKILMKGNIDALQTHINLSHLLTNLYIIQIFEEGRQVSSSKIVKY